MVARGSLSSGWCHESSDPSYLLYREASIVVCGDVTHFWADGIVCVIGALRGCGMIGGSLRLLVRVSAVVLGLVLTAASAMSQSANGAAEAGSGWTSPRTAWGDPDIQGVWDYRTMTPLQRPREFSGKTVLSDEEAAAYTARRLAEAADYDRSPSVHAKWWLDPGTSLTEDKRTSLIVDPPDGRIPSLTAAAKRRNAARGEYRRAHPSDGADNRGLSERCISFGTPRLPGGYNNNYQILQTPSYVVIVSEMVHDTRVVPLDGRSFPDIAQWHGEARGSWEGDTLVIESTSFAAAGAFRGATGGLRLTERFTRVGPDTIQYEITADDPATWVSPWTLMFPMEKTDQPMFEYACHEGNYGLANILRNARLEERGR